MTSDSKQRNPCSVETDVKAMSDFDKAIELDPEIAEAYVGRAICWKNLGDIDKAKIDLAKAKQLGYGA